MTARKWCVFEAIPKQAIVIRKDTEETSFTALVLATVSFACLETRTARLGWFLHCSGPEGRRARRRQGSGGSGRRRGTLWRGLWTRGLKFAVNTGAQCMWVRGLGSCSRRRPQMEHKLYICQ